MVTISDKRFGELVANTLLFETYRDIANSQYEVIQKQDEVSRAVMKEIKRLREELAVSKACEQRLIDELAAVRAEFEQSKANFRDPVNNTEYWMKSSDVATKRNEELEKEVQYWKEMFAISRCTIDKFDGQLKAVKAALE